MHYPIACSAKQQCNADWSPALTFHAIVTHRRAGEIPEATGAWSVDMILRTLLIIHHSFDRVGS
jgi:hypothetical protein